MAKDDAPEDEGTIAPHAFKSSEDGTCVECGRFADDHVHSAASIAAHNASEGE